MPPFSIRKGFPELLANDIFLCYNKINNFEREISMEKLLECCVDSVESAVIAAENGADRLELCANLIIGGTSPSPALFEEIRARIQTPIRVLLRPRFGDFLYTEAEFSIIRREVKLFRELGANGVVIGCLTPDGKLDMERMKLLMEEAGSLPVTLHRAFDVCADPMKALEDAKTLGIDTILTSGQQASCSAGKELLTRLVENAGNIHIMAGAGVNAAVIADFVKTTPLRTFHLSGKEVLQSSMTYRKPGVPMGLPQMDEFQIWRTNPAEIAKARKALDEN